MLHFFFKLLLLFEFVGIYFIFTSSIGANPQNGNVTIQQLSNTFFPEGWAFFTKNPREPLLDIYTINKNGETEKFLLPNGDYYFGMSRKSRVITYQLGILLSEPKYGFAWTPGVGDYKDSLVSMKAYFRVPSDEKYSLFTPGKYILVLTERLPWLWEIDPLNTKKKFRVLPIEII